ncbi:hypothetical protein KKF81_05290 [Candidatus Micrarchaeota archaeon]|nr:hypothetical protein [Candidatus Micrarchaeota archaeon]MBU1166341.1 hypothetical protein [Candidatus Micrarchaeota archaeon]
MSSRIIFMGLLFIGLSFTISCTYDIDCTLSVPGQEMICDEGECMETGAYLCSNDEQCIDEEQGNICMAGYCGFVEPAECFNDSDCFSTIPGYEFICDAGLCMPSEFYLCENDMQCVDAGEGELCISGKCFTDVLMPGCDEDSDCRPESVGPDYICDNDQCEPTGAYLCVVDQDCMDANKGNTCMNGICGNAIEPMICQVDSECPHEIPGQLFVCQNSECIATGSYLCVVDADCENSIGGHTCVAGACASIAQPPEFCPVGVILSLGVLGLGVLSFVFRKK